MTLYSWVGEPLLEHSVEVLEYVKTNRCKELRVAVRLAEMTTRSRPALGERLLLLAAGLHDLGKGLAVYQERVIRFERGEERSLSFKCHEFYSAYAYHSLCCALIREKCSSWSDADELLATAGAQAIVLGHHALNRLRKCLGNLSEMRFHSAEEAARVVTRVAELAGVQLRHDEVLDFMRSLERRPPSVLRRELERVLGGSRWGVRAYKIALILVAPLLEGDNASARRRRGKPQEAAHPSS